MQQLGAIVKPPTQHLRQKCLSMMAAQAVDAQAVMVYPTLALLVVMARDAVRWNTEDPRQSCQSWQQLLTEPLLQVAEGNSF